MNGALHRINENALGAGDVLEELAPGNPIIRSFHRWCLSQLKQVSKSIICT